MSTVIQNPVLTGFNPDPSILRVGSDFYIATSTFEWFPGVQIFHSKDLANWRLVNRPVGENHIDMTGNPPSGGIWAPCLSWDGNLFHLIYTDVKFWSNNAPFKDQLNYLTTAPAIEGPWSPPVYLNGSGFDGSMFHDKDGRKWFLNMEWDHRKPRDRRFSGILLQEYSPESKGLTGPVSKIFPGTSLGRTEAPHLYEKDGWYYLLTAEGGTSYEHAVTVARSKVILGPYEVPDHHPLLTAWKTESGLQKAGHGSLVDDTEGNWYLAHLCGRPLPGTRRCVLGRETAIQEIVWKNGWPRLKGGGNAPASNFSVPWNINLPRNTGVDYTFEQTGLHSDFQTLRTSLDSSVCGIRNACLELRGRESIMSRHDQSIVARRQTDFQFRAETELDFHTDSFQKMAGLIYRYDENNQYYLYLSWDEDRSERVISLMCVDRTNVRIYGSSLAVADDPVKMRLDVENASAVFSFRDGNNGNWIQVGPEVDASILSDDYVQPMGFTGAFVGIACQDLQNRSAVARFHSFRYEPR